MNSVILRVAAKFMHPLLLMFAVFLLLRGHNEPGGGFVAGLVAAAAFTLQALANDARAARRALHVAPHKLIGSGLLIALSAGLAALLPGKPFLTGMWTSISVPALGAIPLGTPLLFDVGVGLVVVGISLLMILILAEE